MSTLRSNGRFPNPRFAGKVDGALNDLASRIATADCGDRQGTAPRPERYRAISLRASGQTGLVSPAMQYDPGPSRSSSFLVCGSILLGCPRLRVNLALLQPRMLCNGLRKRDEIVISLAPSTAGCPD